MRSRSIDNFLSQQENEYITSFIQNSIERFEKYDGLIRMTPKRFNTDELQKIYIAKYNLWDKAVKTQIPNTSSTYLDYLRKSDNPYPCPIEQFLKTFMQIIEQAIPPNKLQNMLSELETELTKCEFTCPCPSEPE